MKLTETMRQHLTLSFEVFPPKDDRPLAPTFETVERLAALQPDFISCTYGAGGTNKGQQREILRHITGTGTKPLANFSCICNTAESAGALVKDYTGFGVQAFLALRGDQPKGQTGTGGDFRYGCELVRFLRSRCPDLTIAAACYPEKHVESRSFEQDLDIMREKQDAGADFFITQLCHDTGNYLRFMEKVRRAGITLPVVFGLMPVLSRDATLRMCFANGSSVPMELSEIITKYGDSPEDFKKAGKEFTAANADRLLGEDLAGFHVFTLNRYGDTAEILRMSALRCRLPEAAAQQ